MSDILEILIQGSLDKSKKGMDSIKGDLKNIQSQLKDEKLKIEVELGDEELSTFKNEIKQLGETLKQTMSAANMDKFEQEMQKSAKRASELDEAMKGVKKQTDLLSKTTKMDFLEGSRTYTQEMQKDLLTVQKTVEKIAADGSIIVDTEERKANYAKVQRELYAQLNKEMSTLHKLEQQRLKAGEDTKAQIDAEIRGQRESMQSIIDTLEAENLRNQALDEAIEKTQQMKAIQDSIRAEQGQEAQSRQAYIELLKLEREKFRLTKLAEQSEGEVNQIYKARLGDVQAISSELRSQMKEGGLTNKEREITLQQEIKKHQTEILALEAKGGQQEALRIARLNERLLKLQDISRVEGEVPIMGNQKNIEGMILSMDEFSNSALRAESKVLSYSNSIDAAGNAQAKMTVQTTHSNGVVKEHRLVVDETTQSVYKLSERTKEASNRSLEFSERMKEAVKRSVQWAISTKLVGEAFRFLADSARHVVELDSQLTQIAMVTGQTRKQVEYLADTYVQLGQEMGKTSTEISAVNTELVRQGLTADESIARMETILQLSSVTGMDAQKTLSIVTSGVNALGEEAEHLADVLVRAGNVSASSAEQVGDSLTKVASSAHSTGTSLEEVTALASTLIEVTQESPSSLGNSLKTLMARFNKVNEETGEMNESLNETQTAFEAAGVSFVDSAGQIRPFYELLEDLSGVWEELDQNTKNYVATSAAGAQQRNRFLAIMENFNRVQQIHSDLLISEGTLMDGYGMYLDSTEAKIKSFTSTLEEGKQQIMSTDTVEAVLAIAESIATLLIQLDKMGEFFGTGLIEMGMVFVMFNRQITGVSQKIGEMLLISLTDSTKQVRILGIEFAATGGGIAGFAGGIRNLARDLLVSKAATDGATAATSALGTATGVTALGVTALSVATKVLLGLGVSMAIGAIMGGMTKLITKVTGAKDATRELVEEASSAIREHHRGIKTLDSLGEEFDSLQEKIRNYGNATNLTEEDQARYFEITEKIRDIAPEVEVAYETKQGAVLAYGTSIDGLIEKEEKLLQLERSRVLSTREQAESEFRSDFKDAKKDFDKEQDALMAKRRSIQRAEERVKRAEIGGNEAEIKREVEALKILRRQLKEIEVAQSGYNAQLEEAKDKYKHIIEAQMLDIELMENVSDSVKNVIREQAMGMLNSIDGAKDAEVFILDITERLKELQSQAESMTPEQTAAVLRELTADLEEMGLTAGEAGRLVHQLGVMLGLFAEGSDFASMSFDLNTEELKGFTNEMEKLSGAYRKLAGGQRLSTDELMDLAIEYEEISEVLAEDGDLTVENMEVIQDLIKQTSRTRADALRQQQEQHSQDLKMKEDELKAHKKTMELMEKANLTTTSAYKRAKEELGGLEEGLKRIQKEYSETARQAKAIENIQHSGQQGMMQEDYASAFAASSDAIQGYREILHGINQAGSVTHEVMMDIINNYPELIGYMHNDEALRERLIELIGLESEARTEHYNQMLASTDTFAALFYNKNRDLVNNVARLYDLDVRNFLGSVSDKARALGQLNQYMSESSSFHSEVMSGDLDLLTAKRLEQSALRDAQRKKSQSSDRTGVSDMGKKISGLQSEIEMLEALERAQGSLGGGAGAPPPLPPIERGGGGSSRAGGSGGAGGSSSSGTTRIERMIEEVELLTDRYLKFDKAVREVNRELETAERLIDLSHGNDRIRLMEKVNSLIREEQRLVALRAAEERKELKEVERGLRARSIDLDDGTFGLDDFARYSRMVEGDINRVIAQINATSEDSTRDSLTKRKETMEKNYNKVKEDFDRYVELRESIPDLGAQWWVLEYEALNRSLEAMDIRYELYDERIGHVSDKIGYMLGIRDDNLEDLAAEKELMEEIGAIYVDALEDVATQSKRSSDRVIQLEARLARMSGKTAEGYEELQRDLVRARAEQDRYFEHYQRQLNDLASHLSTVIDNYRTEVERAKDKTLEAMEEIRVKFDGFDATAFGMSIEQILFDLDSIDDIIETGFEPNLDTGAARDSVEIWKESILGTVADLETLKNKIEEVANTHVDGVDEAEAKTRKLAELMEEQIEKDNELKILQKELQDEIAEMELANKRAERSLQKQIDLRRDELDQLKEKLAYEERLRGLRSKQFELMRAQDERSQTYITGKGEEIFTYDHDRVYAIQQELSEMNRKDREEQMLEEMNEEITKMQEDLEKTRQINAQELAAMTLGLAGIGQLIGISGEGIEATTDSIEKASEEIVDAFTDTTREEFEKYTNFYEDYWDGKLKREIGGIIDSVREIDRGKLGGDRNEPFAAGGAIVGGRPNKVVDYNLANTIGEALISSGLTKGLYNPEAGDTLVSIAEKFNTTPEEINAMNAELRINNDTLQRIKALIVPMRRKNPLVDLEDLLIDFLNGESQPWLVSPGQAATTSVNRNNPTYNKEMEKLINIVLNNPNFNEIHSAEDFLDSMMQFAREGVGRY